MDVYHLRLSFALRSFVFFVFFFFQAEDGIRDTSVTGVQTCALPIYAVEVADPAHSPKMPLPATVVITPVAASRRRIRRSEPMKRFPALSTATLSGPDSAAEVAGPPSPLKPIVPLPATVVMTCVAASIRRIRLFIESAMNRFPALSTATPCGSFNCDAAAGPPSPLKLYVPLPATVVITWVDGSVRRILKLKLSAINRLPALPSAMPLGAFNSAEVASPPSPLKPGVPSPAIVVITPVAASTLRIR